MPSPMPLSNESAYLGSPTAFDVCVAWVRPEVSAACAELLASKVPAARSAQVRDALAQRAQWWASVAEVAGGAR